MASSFYTEVAIVRQSVEYAEIKDFLRRKYPIDTERLLGELTDLQNEGMMALQQLYRALAQERSKDPELFALKDSWRRWIRPFLVIWQTSLIFDAKRDTPDMLDYYYQLLFLHDPISLWDLSVLVEAVFLQEQEQDMLTLLEQQMLA